MIHIITGAMFAGKTSRMIKLAERCGKSVGYFKPPKDTRSEGISTHDGIKRHAEVIRNLTDGRKCFDYDVVCFDEIQFFDPFIVQLVKELNINGKTVYLAGLNRWHDGEIPDALQALLDNTGATCCLIYGTCSHCGEPSERTGKIGGTDSLIEVGAADIYVPLCKNCWEKMYGKPA